MNKQQDSLPTKPPIRRRDFIKTTGSATVAAASWWGITAKTDAMSPERPASKLSGVGDPASHNYDYDADG